MSKHDRDPICPACGHARPIASQRALLAAERAYFVAWSGHASPGSAFMPLEDGMQRLARDPSTRGRWFWACDLCIAARRAIPADVTKQTLSLGTPFAAYVPRPFTCEDCAVASVFTPSEQKRWFETLGFLIWVYPKQCSPCRAKRRAKARANTALAAALATLDEKSPTALEAIALQYDALGLETKAELFRARARNLRKRTP